MPRSIVAASLLVALASYQDAAEQKSEVLRYPAVRHETCLRFYNLKGKVDAGELNEVVRAAEMAVAYGPKEAESRPSNSVVAIEVSAETKSREVERILKKAGVKVEELEVFVFRGRIENGFPTFGIGLKRIDYMLGISGEIRWCDMLDPWTVFYCVKGKLDAEDIEDRWRKLQRPLGDELATLGEVVRDEAVWALPEEIDAARAKKLKKAILKLDGVESAEIEARSLTVTMALTKVLASGPAQGFASERAPARTEAPRVTVLTNELWDLLVDAELTPATAER